MNKSLGEVFRSAWNTTSHNFKTLFTGLLAYTVPTLLLSICSSAISQNPRMVSLGGTISILSILYMVFASPLFMAYMVSILRSYHLTGVPATFANAWGAAKANYVRYLTTLLAGIVITFAAVIIIMLIYMLVAAGTIVSSIGMFSGVNSITDVMAVIAVILPAIIVLVVLLMLYMFCISFVQFIPGMEATSGFGAVFKSFRYIFRGNFWKSLGHVLLIGIIVSVIEMAVMLPWLIPYFSMLFAIPYGISTDMLTTASSTLMFWTPLATAVSTVIGILLQTFTTPYMFEVYLNAKSVSDGKDSQGVMNTAPFNPYTNPGNGGQTWQQPQQQTQQIPPASAPTTPPDMQQPQNENNGNDQNNQDNQ